MEKTNMKVVILAGGLGTRISEESHLIPKPMITIGQKPILWHIMKYYASFGYNEFIILAGYKQNIIKEYFENYHINNNDVTFDLNLGTKRLETRKNEENWIVTIADSGMDTMTGGRLLSLINFIKEDSFLLTYGDGVSDVDLTKLVHLHNSSAALITLTAVKPSGRFGTINVDNSNKITDFREKSVEDVAWINGGFMVVNKEVLNLIRDKQEVLEKHTLQKVLTLNKLVAYKHTGYWQCMDTLRDRETLELAISQNQAPWMVW
jgi:glucose-1-phosphate cytidylyltransferase